MMISGSLFCSVLLKHHVMFLSCVLLLCLLLHVCGGALDPDREMCYSRQHRGVAVNTHVALDQRGTVMEARAMPSEKDCILTCCSEDVAPGLKCNLVVYEPAEQPGDLNCHLFYCPSERECPLMTARPGVNTYNIFKGPTHPTTKGSGRIKAKPTAPQLTTTTPTTTPKTTPRTTPMTTPTTTPRTRSKTTPTTPRTTPTTTPRTTPTTTPTTPRTTPMTTPTTAPRTTPTTTPRTTPRLTPTTTRTTPKTTPLTTPRTPPMSTAPATSSSISRTKEAPTESESPVMLKTVAMTTAPASTATSTTQSTSTTKSTSTKAPRPPPRTPLKPIQPKKPSKPSRPETHSVSPVRATPKPTAPLTTTSTSITPTAPPSTPEPAPADVIEPESNSKRPGRGHPVLSLPGKPKVSRVMWKNSLVATVVITLIFLTLILSLAARKAMESFDRRHYTRLELNDLHYEV